jgi:putative oxidoreductase
MHGSCHDRDDPVSLQAIRNRDRAGRIQAGRGTFMNVKHTAVKAYSLLIFFGSYLQSFVLLFIRLAWGWELWESGHGHISNVAATAKQFAEWGVPFPTLNVYISANTEMIGGILLMVGLATRLISLPLFFNFCVAYLTASSDTIKHLFSQNFDKFVDDTAFPFLITSLLMLAFGPGKFSLDYIIQRLLPRSIREIPKLTGSP